MGYLVFLGAVVIGGGIAFLASEYNPFYLFIFPFPLALSVYAMRLLMKSNGVDSEKESQ